MAVARRYPGEPTFHVAPTAPRNVGGATALAGISGYRAANPTHWFLVTYGLSELFAKESLHPEISGWGLELTWRLGGPGGERPDWALNVLARIANEISTSGDPKQPGDRIDTGAPLMPGSDLSALAFVTDPQLGVITTPHGRVRFLQVVGLTADELALARRWRTEGVLAAPAERNPLLMTDLRRSSLLADLAIRGQLEAEAAAEESGG
jgi:suppressor of fused